jgi:hypothetical protein
MGIGRAIVACLHEAAMIAAAVGPLVPAGSQRTPDIRASALGSDGDDTVDRLRATPEPLSAE